MTFIDVHFVDVAFQVGDAATRYLVLQVHYGKVDQFESKLKTILYICKGCTLSYHPLFLLPYDWSTRALSRFSNLQYSIWLLYNKLNLFISCCYSESVPVNHQNTLLQSCASCYHISCILDNIIHLTVLSIIIQKIPSLLTNLVSHWKQQTRGKQTD